MKSIKIFAISLVALFGLSGCAASWLDQEMTGSALTQEEYNKMNDAELGSVRGLYGFLYSYGGAHDYFGQKSIDIATDLMSSDLAMPSRGYGWFETDAQLIASYREGYLWVYYYDIVMNANAVLRSLDAKGSLTDEEKDAYAQALTMRAYCYYGIANNFTPSAGDLETRSVYAYRGTGADYDLAPIYRQSYVNDKGLPVEQPLSTHKQVREFVRKDLLDAIELFNQSNMPRQSKLYANVDVARALLAYNYLQMAWLMSDEDEYNTQRCYEEAYKVAMDVIGSNNYQMLNRNEVLTTGFVDVNSKSWMWGLDVTAENSTGLASFWGHMDTHTYSYAYAGGYKCCDEMLYNMIDTNDIRKQWFNAENKYVQDWKFYDLNRGVTADEIDRDWKNDVVYLRIEEMYLVAAEAAYRAGNNGEARRVLSELMYERYKDKAVVDNLLSNDANLLAQIYLNWRVEMFGEGRALMTWKRFSADGYTSKNRGSNHFYNAGKEVKSTDINILYRMPSTEAVYNNEIPS